MTIIAHISDLHFGAESDEAVNALKSSLADHKPDIIVVTGDLTQSGRRKEFIAASDFLTGLLGEIFVIPGNHDVPVINLWGRFTSPYSRFRKFISPETDPFFEADDIVIIGLNSARRAALDVNWSYGRLSRRQINDATQKLKNAPTEQLKAIATHHPYVQGPGKAGARIVGRGGQALKEFAVCGVDMIFTGHVHHSKAEIVTIGNHNIVNIQAGTATSVRTRDEQPAYNLINASPSTLEVSTMAFGSSGNDTFAPVQSNTFAKNSDHGWKDKAM